MPLPIIRLQQKAERRIQRGHLWIFKDEVESIPDGLSAGALVKLENSRGRSLGTGMCNPDSTIFIRLLLGDIEELSQEFFVNRLKRARAYRELLLPTGEETYRVAFGESDLLPGLIIDKYGNYFAVQTVAAAMNDAIQNIIAAICEVFPAAEGIIEKNNSRMRTLEGLPAIEGVIWGKAPERIITSENGLLLGIDILGGQKTGYFLDQRVNRAEIRRIASGRRTLDCFTNQGGFALNAALGGASEVFGVDISQSAVDACRSNATLNGITANFVKADVFDFLKNKTKSEERYDLIILDPPAFTKSKRNIPQAVRGYAEINRLAMKLLPSGGLLATASCSHHISEELFLDTVHQQASSLYHRMRLVFRGCQSPDHPILQGMIETQYLKFFIFEML